MTAQLADTVTTSGAGRWRGLADPAAGVVRYRNLRYARADRFAAPVLVPPGEEVNDPFSPVIACPQTADPVGDMATVMRDVRLTEDCQVATVTVPDDLAPGERLPVMVWIHGGSYVSGAGDLAIYDAAALAREGRVAVVNLTYRLGTFGFLGGDGRPANLGLLDLVVGLRWVQEAIAELGGDPGNVTVFGQSAGADAAAHLMVADGTEGLFRRLVLQSGPFGIRGRREKLLRAARGVVGEVPVGATTADVLALKGSVQRAALRFGLRAGMPFAPEYGAAPLPAEAEAEAEWRRRADEVEVMIGWTSDEAAFFLGGLPAQVKQRLTGTRTGAAARRVLVRSLTDAIYRRPGARFADLLGSAVVARYEVQWVPPGNRAGSMHAIELPLLFPAARAWRGMTMLGTLDTARLVEIGAPLRAAWTAFARGEGAPTGDITLPGGGRVTVTR
ncbi:carboxylesterase [Serinibacter arcticus]|uniref:Carboxylesterase n=1 Tax=Serinibacter arcticus TaxID=1655435 RepID=A0A2U1ZVL3_9MICO|nr:carboxylesterase family protein [Serinibacter arcticus]PWD50983.1 carboxylesterase [Serinibacter arcticus]